MTKSIHTRWLLLLLSLLVSTFFLWASTSLLTGASAPHPDFSVNDIDYAAPTIIENCQNFSLSQSGKQPLMETITSFTNTLPISLNKQLTTGIPSSVDQFGTLVAINEDTIALSAYATDTVYVYERDHGGTNNWGNVAGLTASDAQVDVWEWFGIPVALSGNYLVIGAPFTTVDGKVYQGAAYVFERTDNQGISQWLEVAKLTASDGVADDIFGFSLDIDGERIVVGAHKYNRPLSSRAGKAYVFEKQPATNNWLETAILTPTNGYAGDQFGGDVAISNDTIVVGANVSQKAYLFRFSENINQWDEVTTLTPDPLLEGINFAETVEIEGSIILVGHTSAIVNGNINQGAVYVFEKDPNNLDQWSNIATLIAQDGNEHAEFGIDISLVDQTALIGARGDNAAYLFHQNAEGVHQWGQTNKITSSDNNGEFGLGVSIITDTIVIGDRSVTGNNNEIFGKVYIYSLTTEFPLNILFEGSGSGQVIGNLPNIACVDDCIETIEYGTTISLTAIADPHSTFTGWSGNCSGEALTCQIDVLTDTVVSAHFALVEHKIYLPIVAR